MYLLAENLSVNLTWPSRNTNMLEDGLGGGSAINVNDSFCFAKLKSSKESWGHLALDSFN